MKWTVYRSSRNGQPLMVNTAAICGVEQQQDGSSRLFLANGTVFDVHESPKTVLKPISDPPTPPTISGNVPESGVNTPVVRGTAEPSATVTVTDVGTDTVVGTMKADATGDWSLATAQLSVGIHELVAEQIDVIGNSSKQSSPLSLEISAPPLPPGLPVPVEPPPIEPAPPAPEPSVPVAEPILPSPEPAPEPAPEPIPETPEEPPAAAPATEPSPQQ